MFNQNRKNNSKTIKSFLIPATLLLILLTAFGCGNSDNLLSPSESNPEVLGAVKSDSEVFAAPTNEPKIYHGEGLIGPAGGTIHVHGNTKAIFPEGALDNDVYITVEVEVYNSENKIHYIFGPHGTVFNVPVQLEMSWSYLNDYDGPLQLWYLEDNLGWVIVEDAIIEETNSRCIVYVDHFSEYYYPRR
jgi:hypothetical protein